MIKNNELELAWNFVEKTDRNIFLTGKAGTGKTTFLHKIRYESLKRLVVVAPTGVAAINAKGVTIHSFFQMAFGPVLPNMVNQASQRKFSKKKIDIIKSLDLLIIDEISMVRADLLDGIDQVLRRYKDRNKVFGGVQVLMIGDLQQLAPVVKEEEWSLLKDFYKTAFFFSSKSFQESNAIGIELKHIYRQKNETFISILNEIRNNRISESSLETLNARYDPNFRPNKDDGYITLTTHNNQANDMNETELRDLKSANFSFNAQIKGDFPEHIYPTYSKLKLKVGAQVMFIKNDSDVEKRYYNGKIGQIVRINKEQVVVQCPNDDFEIVAEAETWENISFNINSTTKAIEEKVKGKFSQIPLRLAWAITIHKSQGLTFEKAIIDASSSFAHGQTYVALSRCKTLEGIVLKKPISKGSIIHDDRVISFTKNVEENLPNNQMLNDSQKSYQLNLMSELFDYKQFEYPVNKCLRIAYQSGNSIQGNIKEPLNTIKEKCIVELIKISNGFKQQLASMSTNKIEPENDAEIQLRITKAVNYFIEHTKIFFIKPFSEISYSTDNQAITKDLKEQFIIIKNLLESKMFCLKGLTNGFNTIKYLELRAKSVLQAESSEKVQKTDHVSTSNKALFATLRSWRYEMAETESVNAYQIFTQKTLFEMCEKLPVTSTSLRKINGMGKVRVNRYGDAIIDIIKSYCKKNNLESNQNSNFETPKKSNSQKKGKSQKLSLEMFKLGLNIENIARERDLAVSTVTGHLAQFVLEGILDVKKIVSEEKYNEIMPHIQKGGFEGLSELSNKLNNKYSYSELKLVMNDFLYRKK